MPQLELPFFGDRFALDVALDEVRERYGSAAVMRAVLLGRDSGFSMPLLPD
jgi:DNA polymerase-4